MKKTAVWAGLVAVGISATVLIGTQDLSLQQALNQLAGNNKAPYTALSTQQAANVMLLQEQQAAEHTTSMPGVLMWDWDDNHKVLAPDSLFIDAMTDNGIKFGLNMEMYTVLNGDTTATYISIWDAKALQNRGAEIGTAGYRELTSLYNQFRGAVSTGDSLGVGVSPLDSFVVNIQRGVLAQRDSTYNGVGFGVAPRYSVNSNSSASWAVNYALAANGIEYGFAGGTTPSGVSSADGAHAYSYRPWGPIESQLVNFGMFGANGDGAGTPGGSYQTPLPIIRGRLPNRYETVNNLYETLDFKGWKNRLDRAAQFGGAAIFVGHSPRTVGASLTDITPSGGTDALSRFDSLCTFIKTNYIDTGLLLSKIPSDGMDYFYKRPIGPLVNFIPDDFADIDGDTHVDFWFNGRGLTVSLEDTALIYPHTARYLGHPSMVLNWGSTLAQMFPTFTGTGNYRTLSQWAPGSQGTALTTSNQKIWYQTNAMCVAIPPLGEGWVARFEVAAIVDTVASGYSSVTGDSLGISFMTLSQGYQDQILSGGSVPDWKNTVYRTQSGSDSNWRDYSWRAYSSIGPVSGRHLVTLGSRNALYRDNSEWVILQAEYRVPAYCDYVVVSIYKSVTLPAGAVVISNPRLTFYRRAGSLPKFISTGD